MKYLEASDFRYLIGVAAFAGVLVLGANIAAGVEGYKGSDCSVEGFADFLVHAGCEIGQQLANVPESNQ
jgi:hypothetical protein